MDQRRRQKGQVDDLLEDTWFFGNTLLIHQIKSTKSSPKKTIVRSSSDPCPSSTQTTLHLTLVSPANTDHVPPLKMMTNNNNLRRAPSLPVSLGKDTKYSYNKDELVEEEEEDDEPRMGDLIRQAMPIAMQPVSTPRRLDRSMSSLPLPPSTRVVANNEALKDGMRLYTKVSVEESSSSPSLVLPQDKLIIKGPIAAAATKLTRRASIDSSLLLPPKSNSKGTKQNSSNSKKKTPKKQEPTEMNIIPPFKIDHSNNTHSPNMKIKSQKSLSALQSEELRAFKDLGFSSDNKDDLIPNVTQTTRPPGLQRKASLDSRVRDAYFSEPPPVSNWVDPKASSSQDMKAQIKFWARAVASNVRQEC